MTTKAWTFTHRGAPSSVLTLTTTHPAPAFPPPLPLPRAAAQPEEWVLVRPSHAALNPAGLFHMALVPRLFRAATAVPELDFTGTVADVWAPSAPSPPSSSSPSPPPPRFRPGDAVVASLPVAFLWPQGQGALQGLVACPARYCLRRPPGVPPAQAAGLPVAGCTAAQMVEDAGLGRGHRVLVYGASGGVGSLALQLARLAVGEEGTVVAVCSGRNMEMVKGLGADEVLDYLHYKSMPAELRRRFGDAPLDVVLDCVGIQGIYVNCRHFLKPDGRYVAVGLKIKEWSVWEFLGCGKQLLLNAVWPVSPWLGGTGRTWKATSMMAPRPEVMERLVALLDEGKIKVLIDSVWEFEDALKGYAVLESKHARGKVIIKVNDDVD